MLNLSDIKKSSKFMHQIELARLRVVMKYGLELYDVTTSFGSDGTDFADNKTTVMLTFNIKSIQNNGQRYSGLN